MTQKVKKEGTTRSRRVCNGLKENSGETKVATVLRTNLNMVNDRCSPKM